MRERQYKLPSGEWRVEITADDGIKYAAVNASRAEAQVKARELLRTPTVPKEDS